MVKARKKTTRYNPSDKISEYENFVTIVLQEHTENVKVLKYYHESDTESPGTYCTKPK